MKPKRISDLVVAELPEGESVASTQDGEHAVILNAVGSAVLDLCDGARTTGEIAAFLCDRFPDASPARVKTDVETLVEELAEAGLVEDLDPCGSRPSER